MAGGLSESSGGGGSRVYPVEYTYDAQVRMQTMKTWQNFTLSSGVATTTWNYSAERGWLNHKRYADATGPDYEYSEGARLKKRFWARKNASNQRITTEFVYGFDDPAAGAHKHGDVSETKYSATHGYAANSRLVSTVTSKQNSTTRLTVNRNFDLLNRLQNVQATRAAANQLPGYHGYGYNDANQRQRQTLGDGKVGQIFWKNPYFFTIRNRII